MKKLCVVLALLYVPFAQAAYKCVDERGITLIGDVPPPGCATVMMYEVTTSGQVLRKIDPTPTPEQVKARMEEQQKRKEADRIAFEQKRKDVALLNTYSTDKEIDVARDRNIEPIRSRIKGAQERMVAVDKRLREIGDEMEFYQAGKKGAHGERARPPIGLVAEQERALKEKVSLEKSVVEAEREIQQVRDRYEADKRRFAQLKGDGVLRPAAEHVPVR
ncbi:MAG TPA: DUF4124 domain-containing protein [Usitatibacter sp.]|jgi:hypothetical protein|nr:DUF4124 domain-containing protein [Usitatibacter sp.]